jgi:outer membrane protein TolC
MRPPGPGPVFKLRLPFGSTRSLGILGCLIFNLIAAIPSYAQTAATDNPAPPESSATDDPLLSPWVDNIRPGPGEPLPPSEAQLDQILAVAATDSPTMREQADMVAEYDASRFRSWVRYMPALNATYSVGLFYQANQDISGTQALLPGGAFTVQANQPIFYWGAYTATRDLAFLREKIAQNKALLAYTKLCLDLRNRYYDLIVQKSQIALLARQIESAQTQLDKERIELDHGFSTTASVNALDLALHNLEVKKTDADNSFQFNLDEFRRISAASAFTADDVPDRIYLPVIDQTGLQSQYQDFRAKGFDQSLSATDANLNKDAISQQVIINDANQKPLLNASVGVTQSPYQNGTSFEFSTIFFVGVSGSWNIFDREETTYATRALLAQRRVVATTLSDTRNQAFNEAAHSLGQINSGLQSLAVLKRQLAQAQDDYRRVQILRVGGRAAPIDTDAARDHLLDLRCQVLSSQAEVTKGYFQFISDIFSDPALAYAPSFTQPRGS